MKLIVGIAILFSSCATTNVIKSINPFIGTQVGCGDLIVYKLTEDKTQFVSVALNTRKFALKQKQQFGIRLSEVLEVRWKVYEADVSSSLCNDVLGRRPNELKDTEAKSGIVELLVSEDERKKREGGGPYKITLVLKKVVFEGLVIDYLQIDDVNVGWLPG